MNDWRVFRPAIWLAMLGIASCSCWQPVLLRRAVLLGAAIGVALRIERATPAPGARPPPRGAAAADADARGRHRGQGVSSASAGAPSDAVT